MSFLVEDGSGLSNSNAYADVNFADEYFSDRAITAWSSLSNDEKQAALIRATDYIDKRFSPYFRGERISSAQSLEFPRDFVTGIPVVLKQATSEYAIRAHSNPLAPDIKQDPSGFQVSRRFEKVGPLEERTDFAFLGPGSVRQLLTPYPAADMLIRSLLKVTQGRVIRG